MSRSVAFSLSGPSAEMVSSRASRVGKFLVGGTVFRDRPMTAHVKPNTVYRSGWLSEDSGNVYVLGDGRLHKMYGGALDDIAGSYESLKRAPDALINSSLNPAYSDLDEDFVLVGSFPTSSSKLIRSAADEFVDSILEAAVNAFSDPTTPSYALGDTLVHPPLRADAVSLYVHSGNELAWLPGWSDTPQSRAF